MFENKKPMIFDLNREWRSNTEIVNNLGTFQIEIINLLFEDKYIYVLKAKNKEDMFRVFAVSRETFNTQEEAKIKGFSVLNEYLLRTDFRNHIKENLFK